MDFLGATQDLAHLWLCPESHKSMAALPVSNQCHQCHHKCRYPHRLHPSFAASAQKPSSPM
eukprot:4135085-Amphidinium_carterae.1